ncbi:spore coat protein [Clostridium sp. MB40-C1]|uniref:spore coat protein n=1 Tax=Clostridium sp. MB40-C1 TaxID=3070996 RepID=UPI0027E001F1|nr:spore coat protein [Clostridium sp. MB40-C1]WMJ79714.1 spore coat protein [Clostridium sp. MB40-C1]
MISSKETFLDYITKKGVKIFNIDENVKLSRKIKKDDLVKQIYLIKEFHNKAMGYDNFLGGNLQDRRGKTVEQYKRYIRKLGREYEWLTKKKELNSFEKIFIRYGNEYLSKADECINQIYKNNYLSLLKRSMDKSEICLGDTYFTNLKGNGLLEIASLESCCYDMVEMDIVYLLNKVKKKNKDLNLMELVDEFCDIENLGKESKKFIQSLIYYPYDFIKCYMRYKKNGNERNEARYRKKLEKIIFNYKNYILERR